MRDQTDLKRMGMIKMRKLRRKMLRYEAEHRHVKASQFIKEQWHRYQIRQVGDAARTAHITRGTHKKSTWSARLIAYNK